MNKPSIDIFALLVSLCADQMGVEIKYELKEGKK
jgi:hypothetical protein